MPLRDPTYQMKQKSLQSSYYKCSVLKKTGLKMENMTMFYQIQNKRYRNYQKKENLEFKSIRIEIFKFTT